MDEVRTHGAFNDGVYSLYTSLLHMYCGEDQVLHFSKHRSIYVDNEKAKFLKAYDVKGERIFLVYFVSIKINL